MKFKYLKLREKFDSFYAYIGMKNPFLRVLVTIELGRSLLQFVTKNCLIPLENTADSLNSYEKLAVYNKKFIIHTLQYNICFSVKFVFQ